MAWETRRHGHRYYYRASRVDGRVVKRYVGTGELAALLGEFDAYDTQRRQLEAEAERAERADLDTLHREVGDACEVVDQLTRAVLVLAGYHQHDRGQWRKRRGTQDERPSAE